MIVVVLVLIVGMVSVIVSMIVVVLVLIVGMISGQFHVKSIT